MPVEPTFFERPFFLHEGGKPVYCVEYLPNAHKKNNLGIIICKPLWGERIRTHRIFTNLARALCRDGIALITCDHYGDGNSGGDTLDLSFSGMVEDVLSLQKYFRERHGTKEFSLVGFRMGATCAIEAAGRIDNLQRMILIEPILSPIDYLKEGLRSNLTSQMALYKKILKNRETLIREIKEGIPVNMDGFLIGKRLWDSFEAVSVFEADRGFEGEVLVIALAEKGKKPVDYSSLAKRYRYGRSEVLKKEFGWDDWKMNITNPPLLFNRIKNEFGLVPCPYD